MEFWGRVSAPRTKWDLWIAKGIMIKDPEVFSNSRWDWKPQSYLGGGPETWEMIQYDEHIFQMR